MPRIDGNPLRCRVDGVLALVRIDEHAVEHVNKVDEELRAEHALPEIEWAAHLGHEFDEEHGPAVGIYSLHQPHNLPLKSDVRRRASRSIDGLVTNLVGLVRGYVVGPAVGNNGHG